MLAIVAEQTGYPADMLDMDLDLEADLGIDTVKQAEMFAAIREAYGIERDDTLKLRDYPTLNHVVGVRRATAPAHGRRPRRRAEPARRGGRGGRAGGDEVDRRACWRSSPSRPAIPPDMLDLDLDLEADLGIDTVKQAEVFADDPRAYGIERDDTLKLRDYPTLNHVVGFVARPHAAAPTRAAAARRPPRPSRRRPRRRATASTARVLEIVAEQTGYPADMLDLDLDLEADLGIDTVKQAEMFAAIRERYGIERDDTLKLRDYPTLNHVVGFVARPRPRRRPRPSRARRRPSRRRRAVAAAPTAFPRRVPVPVLRPPLEQCVATGVDARRGQPRRR